MKIEIELPDWVENSTIMILSNQELAAFKQPGKNWKVKKTRCTKCGECCLDIPKKHTPFGSDDEGKCNALKKNGDEWICTAGQRKPWVCLGDPLKENVPTCEIEYY